MAEDLPPDLLAALAHNHYDRRWIDFGVLTIEHALEQAKVPWYLPDDPHTEYRRWGAFSAFLSANEALSDAQLVDLLLLIEIDPERSMSVQMLYSLLYHLGLTDPQFERVATHPLLATHSRGVTQSRLWRRLSRGEWSPDLIALCIERGENSVQRMLIEHPNLDRPTLSLLATQGYNKAIRNMAAQRLRSRRFRPT